MFKRKNKKGSELERFIKDRHGVVDFEKNGNPDVNKKIVVFLLLSLLIIFGGLIFSNFYKAKKNLTNSAGVTVQEFKSAVEDLKSLKSQEAQQKFSDIEESFQGDSQNDFFSKFAPLFGNGVKIISGLKQLATGGALVSKEADFLTNNILNLFIEKRGSEIIEHLESLKNALAGIDEQGKVFSSLTEELRSITPEATDNYLHFSFDLSRFNSFLGAAISWFGSNHRLFLMLQNPSELRPSGGFLGSYADVLIKNAGLESAQVHDINDIDRESSLKIVPPKPLQAIVTNWRAADSNWFFDFPSSAQETLKFAEASRFYAASSTKFDAAIAASPKILEDILLLTGPIDLKESKIKLDSKNFLVELQRIVQLGQAQGSTYPKKALGELMPLLLTRVSNFNQASEQEFFSKVQEWIQKRDLVIYLRDPQMQKFLSEYGATGEVYDLPQNFEGDYLSLVNANIGGGKSDLFVKEDVLLESQINSDGTVNNHLVLGREHQGKKSGYWWYRVPNQEYLQIFTSPTSQLINFRGGIDKNIIAPINYEKSGFLVDQYVSQIESKTEKVFNYQNVSVHDESGKRVFSTWSKLGLGEKKQITLDYKNRLFLPPSVGGTYQFVFEKQPGTVRHYKFELSAPLGMKFKESDSPVYDYVSDDPPGRIVINLTLEKI